MATTASYRPDPQILALGLDFYDPVEPARFPKAIPRFLNEHWAKNVGLDLDEAAWEAHFHRFEPLPGNRCCLITCLSRTSSLSRTSGMPEMARIYVCTVLSAASPNQC
jgi:hypothetical protein